MSRPDEDCMAHINPPSPPMMPPVTIAGTRTLGPLALAGHVPDRERGRGEVAQSR